MKQNLICTIIHGSHLYGLNTPASDMDYKSIYLPQLKDVLLDRVAPNLNMDTKQSTSVKNTSDDIDHTVFSYISFVNQLVKGEMVAMDMIHAQREQIQVFDPKLGQLFFALQDNREMFYCKSMRSFLGYVRKQAAKYGIKGSRIAELRLILAAVDKAIVDKGVRPTDKLSMIADLLPTGEFCNLAPSGYHVTGKCHQLTVSIEYFVQRMESELNAFGARALMAESNSGVDYKAVSHAFRAGYQLLDLFTNGTMTLPFVGATRRFLLSVKAGELEYAQVLQPMLEDLMTEVEAAAAKSSFPENVDDDKVNDFVFAQLREAYKGDF